MTNMPRHVADRAGCFRLGPDHEPGRVARGTRSAGRTRRTSCRNRAALSAPGRVDRATEVRRVVGDDADGRDPRRARSAVMMPAPNRGRSSSTEPVSHNASSTVRTSYARTRFSGTRWRSVRWSAHSHSSTALAEVREVLLRDRDRLGFVGHEHVDHAVRDLHVDRPDRGRLVRAEPAAFDHRGAAHADVRTFGRDDHVAAAEERGVAGEAVAGGDADERDERR